MRQGFLSDDLEEFQPDPEDDLEPMTVDSGAGNWVRCPHCGSTDAGFIWWGEGVDMDFHCPECGASYGVR